MKRKSVFLVVLAAVMLFAFAVVGNAGMNGVVHSFDELTKPFQAYTTLASGVRSDYPSLRAAVQVKESLLYNSNGSCTFLCKIQRKVNGSWLKASDDTMCFPADQGVYLYTNIVDYKVNNVPVNIPDGTELRARGKSISLSSSGEPMRGFINFN